MKDINKKFALVIWGTLLMLISSCGISFSECSTSERIVSKWIDFPYITVDTFYLDNHTFHLIITDSTPYLNPVIVDQYVAIHSLQSEPKASEFDTIQIEINMPVRPDGGLEIKFTSEQFLIMSQGFSNRVFKNFIHDFLVLNDSTAIKYRKRGHSLLDQANMIFGKAIDHKYRNQFPENSTWNGYSAFRIFGIFIEECLENKPGIGHDLVNSLDEKSPYVFDEDIETLKSLIKQYQDRIKKINSN